MTLKPTAVTCPQPARCSFPTFQPSVVTVRLVAILFVCLAPAFAFSQPEEQRLRVATRIIKPFVFEENQALTGFSIELWREISSQLNAKSEFVMKPSVKELLEATRSKEVDLAIAAISITAEREIDWDFSAHVRRRAADPHARAGNSWRPRCRDHRWTLFIRHMASPRPRSAHDTHPGSSCLVLRASKFNRHDNSSVVLSRHLRGLLVGGLHLATQADQMPRATLARIVAVVWMFASVVFIAYFTAL